MEGNKALVILAAGLGFRYGGVKQIDPLGPGGEILMEYAIYDALRAGFDRLVIILRPEIFEDFTARFGGLSSPSLGVKVDYAFQRTEGDWDGIPISPARTKPLGTVHALLCARAYLSCPFAVINADDYYGPDAFVRLAAALDCFHGAEASAMVAYRLQDTVSPFGSVTRGICTERDGFLTKVNETHGIISAPDGSIRIASTDTPLSPDALVSMNIWGFHPDILPQMNTQFCDFLRELPPEDNSSEFPLPVVMDTLITGKKTSTEVLRADGRWFGVTCREDKPGVAAALQALHDAGIYPPALRK